MIKLVLQIVEYLAAIIINLTENSNGFNELESDT